MDGAERPHAAASRGCRRARLEGIVAQQRIEPDEAAAGAFQAIHLEGEIGADLPLEAVGEEQHVAPCPSTRRDQSRLKSCSA